MLSLEGIWFSSLDHKNNYVGLLNRFDAFDNEEYAAACYIAAHPEIYDKVNWIPEIYNYGPVGWYWGEWIGEDDDDPNGYHLESEIVSYLSSAYRGLARAAVELYTGRQHHFDLMGWLGNAGDEVFRLFVQSLEIRRGRSALMQKGGQE